MTDKVRPAAELEAEARAINATDWEPLSGMVKNRCSQCRYWFAVPIAEADATSRCPDCATFGSRPCSHGCVALSRARQSAGKKRAAQSRRRGGPG
jgi:hypothetical protein